MIKIDNLTIKFPTITPFHQFDLAIGKGEKCVISGPSGRGKSTLLNAIMGFVIPSEGTITVNGITLAPHTAMNIRQLTAYIPQEVSISLGSGKELLLYPYTFRENKAMTPSTEEIGVVTQQLMLDEATLLQPIHQLSGGQRQRLLIASALLSGKRIFLWDEPSSALDNTSTSCVLNALDCLPYTTLISVSHDPVWIGRMQKIINL